MNQNSLFLIKRIMILILIAINVIEQNESASDPTGISRLNRNPSSVTQFISRQYEKSLASNRSPSNKFPTMDRPSADKQLDKRSQKLQRLTRTKIERRVNPLLLPIRLLLALLRILLLPLRILLAPLIILLRILVRALIQLLRLLLLLINPFFYLFLILEAFNIAGRIARLILRLMFRRRHEKENKEESTHVITLVEDDHYDVPVKILPKQHKKHKTKTHRRIDFDKNGSKEAQALEREITNRLICLGALDSEYNKWISTNNKRFNFEYPTNNHCQMSFANRYQHTPSNFLLELR